MYVHGLGDAQERMTDPDYPTCPACESCGATTTYEETKQGTGWNRHVDTHVFICEADEESDCYESTVEVEEDHSEDEWDCEDYEDY